MLVSDRQMDVGRVMVVGATELIGVFYGGVACLNSLLREGEIGS
jgi:hypothetical protein